LATLADPSSGWRTRCRSSAPGVDLMKRFWPEFRAKKLYKGQFQVCWYWFFGFSVLVHPWLL
jgi:hypothetical protein